jgi:hypothetical protein
LVLHSLLRECGTTVGAKDIEIYIEKLDPFGLRITWGRYPHVYIQTRLHFYNTNFLSTINDTRRITYWGLYLHTFLSSSNGTDQPGSVYL